MEANGPQIKLKVKIPSNFALTCIVHKNALKYTISRRKKWGWVLTPPGFHLSLGCANPQSGTKLRLMSVPLQRKSCYVLLVFFFNAHCSLHFNSLLLEYISTYEGVENILSSSKRHKGCLYYDTCTAYMCAAHVRRTCAMTVYAEHARCFQHV